jgi:hypothetical protein
VERRVGDDESLQHRTQLIRWLRKGRRRHPDADVRRAASHREQPGVSGESLGVEQQVGAVRRARNILEVRTDRHDPATSAYWSSQLSTNRRIAPVGADQQPGAEHTCGAVVGYVDGDYCLFYSIAGLLGPVDEVYASGKSRVENVLIEPLSRHH